MRMTSTERTPVTAPRTSQAAASRTMRAAILERQRAPLTIADDVEIPELAAGHVLVRVAFSGVCGKQLEELSGRRGADPYLPHLLGHEAAGTVVEIGPGVRKVTPGDRVVLHWMKGSGIDAVPASFRRGAHTVNAGCVTTFSEQTVVSENRVTPIPRDAELDVAALLGCAVTTGLGIVFNNAALRPGQSIAVFGAGGVGLNVLQGAALVHAHPIVAIDVHDHKLDQAKRFGATRTLHATRVNVLEALRDLSGGRGFDATVDLTGEVKVRELAYQAASHTGRAIFGGVPEAGSEICIDSFPLHFGRRVLGVHGGDTRPDIDIPAYLGLYARGQLKLKEQITHRFRLEQVNEALEVVRRGEAGRCLLDLT